ncbi:hypothetical protein EV421DRAFT_1743378 [Armillaria borealis]|uniref:Uncharacterized protein n=1 Tax=Armillaria borealis TaxID=47425 RepID=A0AA39IYE2_9AGAR|nr:hypothetical protein EV421DRAFT_1743378 [Armillaria borealis]
MDVSSLILYDQAVLNGMEIFSIAGTPPMENIHVQKSGILPPVRYLATVMSVTTLVAQIPMELLRKIFLATKEGSDQTFKVGDSMETRFGNQPLHFWFTSSSVEGDKEASFAVFQMLLSHGTRWRLAILCINSLYLPLLDSLHGTIIGLGPATSVFLPVFHLTQFVDRRFTINGTMLEHIVEMQYLHITGISSHHSTSHSAVLSRVVFFRMGCITVMDSVNLPILRALLVGTGFYNSAGLNHPNLDPLTLTSVKNMLIRSKCQNMLHTIEFRRLTLTDDILAIIHLSPALDAMLLEYIPHHLVLSFYHDSLIDTMESRVSSVPDMQFSLSILFKNDDASFVPLNPDSQARLVQCRKNGSVCTFTVGDVTDEHDSIEW